MEVRKTEEKLSVSSSLSSSWSLSLSSSSSCSSSYCSSMGENHEDRSSKSGRRMRFIDFLRDNEWEWKLAEKRFDELCWICAGNEPAIKSSNFPFCIGESFLFLFILLLFIKKMRYKKLSS